MIVAPIYDEARFSALQRAENSSNETDALLAALDDCFSALQRAENSSNAFRRGDPPAAAAFQCSSASRKFLKPRCRATRTQHARVSVLFSEPKIPQTGRKDGRLSLFLVSVLFSEPKIPQMSDVPASAALLNEFQCSSASRKFLKVRRNCASTPACTFQCSSASRKFLKKEVSDGRFNQDRGFSALQRAENSSNDDGA